MPSPTFSRQRLLQAWLRILARLLLAKYHPVVIGVTGSVGKSSTKEAIALALSDQVRVRKSEGNYNNEIGIPLTILGTKSAGRSIWGWIRVSFRFLTTYLAGRSRYPEVLVLELGIDAPGDMDYLVSFLPIQVGVVTHISESHVEHFGSLAAIAKEKGKLIESLPPSGTAILSADDARVSEMQSRTQARVITYGFGEQADVRGDHLAFHPERNGGYTLKISYQGKSLPLRLPHIIARHHIPAVLAALAVAVSLKVNLVEVANTLAAFRPLPGRLNLLSGKYGTQLLDDTYNASRPRLRLPWRCSAR
ncbi:MAG: UDP-N-acetylmuramoyl-tripeptide--D-alanyl-D-alanine ligase [Candidatus Moraniibacteriota bacterium]